MSKHYGAALLAGVVTACSPIADGAERRAIDAKIVLANQTRLPAPPPPGPFVSVLDSIDLRVTPENGEPILPVGQRLRGYTLSAALQSVFPAGRTTFVAQVLTNTRVSVFSGTMTQAVTIDGDSVVVPVVATRPVLLMVPDTARTSLVASTQFAVYNAGSGALAWNVASTDTAFTRCAAQCTITPSSGSVAPGAATTMRVSVPFGFPSRLFSFVVQSNEGSVRANWQYTGSPIIGVAIQPNASLHALGQTFALTPVVQTTGAASSAVTWTSSNVSVALVSGTGAVTGVSRGIATVTATSAADTSKRGVADIRVYDSSATVPPPPILVAVPFIPWAIVQPVRDDTVRRDDTTPGARSTTVIQARLIGPQATATSPFTLVEFWGRGGAGGPWRRLGQTAAGTVTADAAGNRTWLWSITWNPDATDAPFTAPLTRMSILAIGITPALQTMPSLAHSNVYVRVP